jgi:hypothetical protein
MDVPINLLQWEVFLPERYKVKDFGGDVTSANLVPPALQEGAPGREMGAAGVGVGGGIGGGIFRPNAGANVAVSPGQLGGLVVDPSGAAISGAHVTVTNLDSGFAASAFSDPSGRWLISNFPAGRARITADARGFKTTAEQIDYDAGRAAEYPIPLGLGAATETVEVTAESVNAETSNLAISGRNYAQLQQLEANAKKQEQNAASANVMNLQRRVAGVLPVAVAVPRTGTSFQFVRPLVLNEETRVTFSYKSK